MTSDDVDIRTSLENGSEKKKASWKDQFNKSSFTTQAKQVYLIGE